MTNDPMQLLTAEHDVIITAKDVIDRMDQLWLTDEAQYEDALRTLLSFFAKYSDGFHHQKEERALFPALKHHPDFFPQDLVDELEEHHARFREHVAEIESALAGKKYDLAQSRLTTYLNELLDHIAVENDELFVMSSSLFNENELERLYFAFKDIDRELGEDSKKQLEGSLDRLRVGR